MLLPGNYTETANARFERRKRPEPAGPAAAEKGLDPTPRAAPAAPPAPRPEPRPARADSSEDREASRRRKRLKSLEEKIASLENEIEAIETRLWEEALTLGPRAAHELATKKTASKAELDALVEDWARLSQEAEEPAPRGQ